MQTHADRRTAVERGGKLTEETIHLPQGCLQGGFRLYLLVRQEGTALGDHVLEISGSQRGRK